MSFVFELETRPEVRQDLAGVVRFRPKLDGQGRVAASATAGAHRATVYSPTGEVLAGPTVVSATAEGDVSRFDVAVPAIAELGEDYHVVLEWTPDGATTTEVQTIYFDVVLQPWGPSPIALSDLLTRVPGVRARLDRQRARLDPDGTLELTVEMVASQHAARAHAELYERLAGRIAVDTAASGGTKVRPRLITNRHTFHAVEVALTLKALFLADVTEGPSFDGRFSQEARALYDEWTKLADAAFVAIPELRYDLSEDRNVDSALAPATRAFRSRRVQG